MCGIAGFYNFSGRPPVGSADLLDAMVVALAHRGPDGEGTWLCHQDGIGLGNRRLAIIDRSSAGSQPMRNEEGTVRITFNGEIYNHSDLRAELAALGHTFRSRSDTEAIVHAYEQWGLGCFSHFNGMWALGLWDATRKRLVLSRDRLGIKPLYYLVRNGQIRFASEVKSLLADPNVVPEMDFEALSLYLTYLVPPAPRTLFQGVYKLPAAHILLAERARAPQTHPFWDPLEVDNALVRHAARLESRQLEAFAVEAIHGLLKGSIKRQMISDVPIGLFLSGGLDSSTLAGLMREHVPGRMKAFSVGYDEPDFTSELPESRRVAQLLDFEHHEVVLTEQDLIDSADELVYHLDEPNADWVNFPLYYLGREARRCGTPVILTGEGSDELFGGYPGYLRAAGLAIVAHSPLWRLPAAKLLLRMLEPLLQAAARASGRGHGLLDDLERMARGEPIFISLQIGLTEQLKRRVLALGGQDGRSPTSQPSAAVAHHIARAVSQPPPIHWSASLRETRYDQLRWISYLELKQRLPEMLLTRLDKMTMAHGVECRVPYLDHELVEFITALPGSLRLRGGVSKYLLKRAAERRLPSDLVHRPKLAFGAPVSQWLRKRLGQRVAEQLADSGMVREGILRADAIKALTAAHRAGQADHGQAIWSLYTVSRWYDAVLTPIDYAQASAHAAC
jgi:asparagine synthase (glutamine-hydrolysing)